MTQLSTEFKSLRDLNGVPLRPHVEPYIGIHPANLKRMSGNALIFGATELSALIDNAARTYLGSLVEGISDELTYSLVAGAVMGGGLMVIANAPNPPGIGTHPGCKGVQWGRHQSTGIVFWRTATNDYLRREFLVVALKDDCLKPAIKMRCTARSGAPFSFHEAQVSSSTVAKPNSGSMRFFRLFHRSAGIRDDACQNDNRKSGSPARH